LVKTTVLRVPQAIFSTSVEAICSNFCFRDF